MIEHKFIPLPIPEGFIYPDSDFAKFIGFTKKAGFSIDSYMVGYPDYNGLCIALIICNKKGSFRNLMTNIINNGYIFRILTPLARITEIAQKQGWYFGTDGETDFVTNEKPKGV